MIKLIQTCGACPEQYDAVDENGEAVGYLRLRHGYFSVECPTPGGTTVYEARPEGDGVFEFEERDFYLRHAVAAIQQWITAPNSFDEKPSAPDVEYTIEYQ